MAPVPATARPPPGDRRPPEPGPTAWCRHPSPAPVPMAPGKRAVLKPRPSRPDPSGAPTGRDRPGPGRWMPSGLECPAQRGHLGRPSDRHPAVEQERARPAPCRRPGAGRSGPVTQAPVTSAAHPVPTATPAATVGSRPHRRSGGAAKPPRRPRLDAQRAPSMWRRLAHRRDRVAGRSRRPRGRKGGPATPPARGNLSGGAIRRRRGAPWCGENDERRGHGRL